MYEDKSWSVHNDMAIEKATPNAYNITRERKCETRKRTYNVPLNSDLFQASQGISCWQVVGNLKRSLQRPERCNLVRIFVELRYGSSLGNGWLDICTR